MQKLAAAYKRVLALVFVGVYTSTVGQFAAHVSCSTQRGWESFGLVSYMPLGQFFFAAATSGGAEGQNAPLTSRSGVFRGRVALCQLIE